MTMDERRSRLPAPVRLQDARASRKPRHPNAKMPATAQPQRRHLGANSSRVTTPTSEDDAEMGAAPVAFRVLSATGAASAASAQHLVAYSKRSCWQSFSRQKESVVLALYVLV